MRLFKNVDICDLESIMEKGILSMDESGNDNWLYDNRADNRTDVVYLFDPIGEQNSFTQYGAALLECDTDAEEQEIARNDRNRDKYREYITEKVAKEQIKRVIIPEIFRERVHLPENIHVTWCKMEAEHWDGSKVSDEILKDFGERGAFENSARDQYFRYVDKKHRVDDFYNIKYIF